ncbi:RNA polymerase sigma factor [Mucilaginibacter sp. BT774]|uniref:RNA polymerase sigma factor n=1 Tax=Mucilaginibacter sp. BT774 TaxID=3062276 RepID=UPI0026765F07|nr:RNA polymerase sigma-70 factor [Mucilaginibacter sp. BT774]MDO3628348.1 RNA polymerase sigma-70 factor [Mucilaginibacter sp. BT774]
MEKKFIDENAIRQLIAGDQSVFTAVYELYSEKVYRLAFRFLKDSEQSEEIVQETFINFWLSREKLDPCGDLWLYLYVISKRLSLNALRQIGKSSILLEKLLYRISDLQNTTEEKIIAHDLEHYTQKLINQLPPQQQLVFRLSRIEGMSHKEIAEQLDISQNTVKNHMVEALKTLRKHLKYADFWFLVIFLIYF